MDRHQQLPDPQQNDANGKNRQGYTQHNHRNIGWLRAVILFEVVDGDTMVCFNYTEGHEALSGALKSTEHRLTFIKVCGVTEKGERGVAIIGASFHLSRV